MKNKVMTALAIILTISGLLFNMQYVFSKGLQIGINEEKYIRNVYIEDSYNKGLTTGMKRATLYIGKENYFDALVTKKVEDATLEGFFQGYAKGLSDGTRNGMESCLEFKAQQKENGQEPK